jgi:isopentenyldiphosphate isomerase
MGVELNAGDELVDVVDEFDEVIDVVPRRVMRSDRLRHRAVFIAILDGAGRLLVHRRSPLKDIWPSWCDIAVGGVVGVGEPYLEAAHRELAEEVGVSTATLDAVDRGEPRQYDDDQVSLMARCYVMMVKWLRLGGCIVTVLMTCCSAKSFFLTVWLYFSP